MDGCRSEFALVSAKCAGAGRKGRRYFGEDGGTGTARANFREIVERGGGCKYRQSEIFSRDARKDCWHTGGYFAHRLYGRSGLRNLDAVGQRIEGVGRPGEEGQAV